MRPALAPAATHTAAASLHVHLPHSGDRQLSQHPPRSAAALQTAFLCANPLRRKRTKCKPHADEQLFVPRCRPRGMRSRRARSVESSSHEFCTRGYARAASSDVPLSGTAQTRRHPADPIDDARAPLSSHSSMWTPGRGQASKTGPDVRSYVGPLAARRRSTIAIVVRQAPAPSKFALCAG